MAPLHSPLVTDHFPSIPAPEHNQACIRQIEAQQHPQANDVPQYREWHQQAHENEGHPGYLPGIDEYFVFVLRRAGGLAYLVVAVVISARSLTHLEGQK